MVSNLPHNAVHLYYQQPLERKTRHIRTSGMSRFHDEERPWLQEDRPAKKVKVDKARGLMDMLPAPKHSMPAPKRDNFVSHLCLGPHSASVGAASVCARHPG